jgi:hypothetical protein
MAHVQVTLTFPVEAETEVDAARNAEAIVRSTVIYGDIESTDAWATEWVLR